MGHQGKHPDTPLGINNSIITSTLICPTVIDCLAMDICRSEACNALRQAAEEAHAELLDQADDPRHEVVTCLGCGIAFLRDKRARKQNAYCPFHCAARRRRDLSTARSKRHRARHRNTSIQRTDSSRQAVHPSDEPNREVFELPEVAGLDTWSQAISQPDADLMSIETPAPLPVAAVQTLVSMLNDWQWYAYRLAGAISYTSPIRQALQDAVLVDLAQRNINCAQYRGEKKDHRLSFRREKASWKAPPKS